MNINNNINSILVVGGGTAGWMVAAALAKVLKTSNCRIALVESEQIGRIGVGEATIPSLAVFNKTLGIDERDFMRSTQATFKLGIDFINWDQLGKSYIHPFSQYGSDMDNVPFFHYWQKAKELGITPELDEFSLAVQACKENRFMRAQNIPNSPLGKISHAYHLDATLYAEYLRAYSENLGVERIEGKITDVHQHENNGYIKGVTLENGDTIEADFFMDCSGFKGLLIEETLNTGYEDWSHYLPADSAIAVPSTKVEPLTPYTKSIAHASGWQWRIPLQHRTGNGIVYSNRFMSDDEAKDILLKNLDGTPLSEPRIIKFQTGKRKKIWNKNVVSVGLASGFVEPLESTSIYLVQSVISKFLALFPQKTGFQAIQDKFNANIDWDYESIRDFIILHYKATRRNDSPFWNFCRTMEIPATLQKKLDLYQSSSQIFRDNFELFSEPSWLAVMHGQGIKARGYNPIVDCMPVDELEKRLKKIHQVIQKCVTVLPPHQDFIEKYCKSETTD